MRNRKFRKKGLGISTIALMVFSIAIMVLPMNVAAIGSFGRIHIDNIWVPYGTTYGDLDYNDFVNGTYSGASVTPIFEWRLDFGDWNDIDNVVPLPLTGSYAFNFTMDGIPDPPGSFWIQATENLDVTEWHCYYN